MDLEKRMGAARVTLRGERLSVSTGQLERTWHWTGRGLATVGLRNLATEREWATRAGRAASDWCVYGIDDPARLMRVSTRAVWQSPWTSPHIEVASDVACPDAGLSVRHVIWVYPDSPGIRTQLRLKAMPGFDPSAIAPSGRAELVPLDFGGTNRHAIGYYNQTQQRNTASTPLLEEEPMRRPLRGRETIDWASLLCVEGNGEGLCVVKESHKCVNQQGVDTGNFVCDDTGLASTGLGPAPDDLLRGRYRECWANWCIVYEGGNVERQFAIKTFDRIRYPIDPRRDLFVMANTWGSTANKAEAQAAAGEENVLREIDSQADLGIDVQQIDDGWQGSGYRRWRPAAARYPDGWRNVRAAAEKRGVQLGLWAAWNISRDALVWNYDRGGFRYFKIDFASLDTWPKVEALMSKVRALVEHSGHTVRVNWDVTENPPRVGYYFARDLGNIYLENRKPVWPPNVVYVPWLVLRDAWELAHYVNLNKFQISVQNLDRVDRERSNAHEHRHDYCVAITLMGSPIFFQETHYYDEAARQQIRPLIAIYKKHREAMFRGIVFPIGERPSDGSWTGFQCHIAEEKTGYLTVFRELHNGESRARMALGLLAGRSLALTDLCSGVTRTVKVRADGTVAFHLARPASFQFLRYDVV